MLYAGIDWPEGWQPGDRHVTQVLGLHVLYHTENNRAFRVRVPMIRELSDGMRADTWVAEYLTRGATWDIAACQDPLLACAMCLLFDTSEADRSDVW